MLLEVKCRVFDPITRRPHIEPLIVDVPSGSGDEAAEMAHALRPGCHVVGIAPPDPEAAKLHADRQHAAMEGESEAPDMSVDRPSRRDMASIYDGAQQTLKPPDYTLAQASKFSDITVDQTTQPVVIEIPASPKRGRGKRMPIPPVAD